MRTTITLSGPQGSGKTVLARFIAKALREEGVPCEVRIGRGAPDSDYVAVETTPELLAKLDR